MKIQTSKERRAQEQPLVPESYQHPKAIRGHVYMISRRRLTGGDKGTKYYAVVDNEINEVRLYSLSEGVRWCAASTFGDYDYEWKDITDKVYLNTDDLEAQQ